MSSEEFKHDIERMAKAAVEMSKLVKNARYDERALNLY